MVIEKNETNLNIIKFIPNSLITKYFNNFKIII